LQQTQTLREQIHNANIIVHEHEAQYYELLHPEVYNTPEQKRITTKLIQINNLIENNNKRALDVGAGTGNLTSKLLQAGYSVVANDISPEMCRILKEKFAKQVNNGKLVVVSSPVEELTFGEGTFDLVTCYSVLHHLPDYLGALSVFASMLRRGGVIYVDHEASPYYWIGEPSSLGSLIKDVYFHSNPLINALYFRLIGLNVPTIDYTLSDYWHKKEHAINHAQIQRVFNEEGFRYAKRFDYHLNGTWSPNPLFPVYKLVCQPEMSYWIAKR
jgi:ubiquinone/menaquinone biosynthesis C-methylase UbiE